MTQPKSLIVQVLFQLVASVAGGVALGALGGLVGSQLGKLASNGWGDLVGAILLAGGGYLAGAGLGAHLAGRKLDHPGAWWMALVASFGAGVLILVLAEPTHLNSQPALMRVVFAIAAPLAATLVPRLLIRAY
jgi:hypothetical protein